MTIKWVVTGLVTVVLTATACENSKKLQGNNKGSYGLKDAYQKDFLIGTALNTAQIQEKDTAAARLIRQQFNAITPENIMKAEIISQLLTHRERIIAEIGARDRNLAR